MSDLSRLIPRERLDALNGWQPLVAPAADQTLLPEGDVLHLAAARMAADGSLVFAQPIPDTDPYGSLGGRSLPRGVAVSEVGDVYLCEPETGTILYTRAALPPEAKPDSTAAPFVPLWHFPSDPGAHPLNMNRPLDLALVPENAAPGQFGDALVVADAGRALLVWVDRRQIVTRHTLALEAAPQAVAAGPNGDLAVLVAGAILRVRRGALVSRTSLDQPAHSVVALTDGSFAVIGASGVQRLSTDDRLALATAPFEVRTPAFEVIREILHVNGACAAQVSLPYPHIPITRSGRLGDTGLHLVSRPARQTRPRSGSWISDRFDGEMRGFAWDRIALEADIPGQCRLIVSSYVSDEPLEPAQIAGLADWSGHAVFEPGMEAEALIQANRGRYLWLRLEAFGDGSKTPTIHGIDLFGPRDSQLALLPAPFHQDPISADFLDRFLSLQDAFLSEALWLFQSVGAILRPEAAPEDFVDWLGSWFDWRFLARTDIATRREMIARSFEMFGKRGTVEGLETMLRWHTGLTGGALPVIVEDFTLGADSPRFLAGRAVEAGGAHRFSVVVPRSAIRVPEDEAALHRMIAAQKPAHTVYRLDIVEPGLVPGTQARLGVDAILPDSRPRPLGEGRAGTDLQTVATC
ncbi:MAG: phage tail protein [Pseudomonadota bacterium]